MEPEASSRLERRLVRARQAMLALEAAGLAAGILGIWLRFGAPPAVIAILAALVWLSRLRDIRLVASRMEQATPSLDRELSAWAEGGGGLRDRLAGWILKRSPRARPAGSWTVALAGIAVLVASMALPRVSFSSSARLTHARTVHSPHLAIRATVTPPSYTGRSPIEIAAPGIEVLRGSSIRFLVTAAARRIEIQTEGQAAQTVSIQSGKATWSLVANDARSVRFFAEAAPPVVWPIRVVADAPPGVELTSPAADVATNSIPPAIAVRADAKDDIGLATLSIRWTLAHGRGESMAFRNGLARSVSVTGRTGSADALLDPKTLGMAIGDTLVVWAEATDRNAIDGPGRGISPARVVRWEENLPRLQMPRSGDPFRLADGLLSEREILARTLRLLARPGTKVGRAEASRDLAADQRQLREAFSQFTQGEDGGTNPLDVDAPEAGAEGDTQGRNLLAAAVSEMWSAERELEAPSPARAVPYEKRAVKLLDEVFGGARLALRALAAPRIVLDPKRRLAGDASDLHPATVPAKPDSTLALSVAKLRIIASDLYRFCFSGTGSARVLADTLWNAPDFPGLDRAAVAAPLYSARTAGESEIAARAAADAIVRLLEPAPIRLVPASKDARSILDRLEPAAEGRPRTEMP